jgi:ribosomal-protein-alanine N-acetyltransferase
MTSALAPVAQSMKGMSVGDLDRVLAVEAQAYSFPWTRGNFIDSLAAGYVAELLLQPGDDAPIGYYVAMPGVDELHLLNFTVAPQHQGKGHSRRLLQAVESCARLRALASILLEVRVSNLRALRLYEARGFVRLALRPSYYPAGGARREDAVVMQLRLEPAGLQGSTNAVD